MKSPLLQKKGMDALLEALNDPETATNDPRADKEYSHPFGSKGTEPENVKYGVHDNSLADKLVQEFAKLGLKLQVIGSVATRGQSDKDLDLLVLQRTSTEDIKTKAESLGLEFLSSFTLSPEEAEHEQDAARPPHAFAEGKSYQKKPYFQGWSTGLVFNDGENHRIEIWLTEDRDTSKQGASWGLLNDVLHPDSRDPQELQPYRTQEKANVCPDCGGGLTRIGNPNGKTEWVCTRCKFGPRGKRSSITVLPALNADDLRAVGSGKMSVDQFKAKYPKESATLTAFFANKRASKPNCPACGSTKFGLMPADFETAKCDKCEKTWEIGLVKGINAARKLFHDDSGATTGLRNRPDYGEFDSHTSIMNEQNSKSAAVKLKWRVDSAPTGPYSSFQKRNWPMASYVNDTPAVQLICEDDYRPSEAKSGQHAPIKVWIADHSQKPWKWRAMKGEHKTLAEAKAAAQGIIEKYPQVQPQGAGVPPPKQSRFKSALLQKKAITDFDKEQAIEHYREQDAQDIAQQEVFPDSRKTRDWAVENARGGKQADVEIHETSRHLPPRKDMQTHLDADVQKEIDADIDTPVKEGIKVGATAPLIKTVCQNPPIPIRDFDWAAYDDNTYDGAPDAGKQCVGYGATEEEAVADFKAQWAEMYGGEEKTAGPLRKALLPAALALSLGLSSPTPADSDTFTPQQIQQQEQKALELQKQKTEKEQMERLIAAIARAEGAKPERNNPGNIADTNGGGIRTFDSYEEGEAALRDQLNRIAEGVHTHIKPDMTLEKAGLIYADGDPNWANNVSKIMHVPKHITMAELIRGPQKKMGAGKQADDPAWESDLERREEHFNDQVYDAKNEAREAFMNDSYMQEEAREAGISLEQLWQETGNDYANEYWASRYGSKAV